jgi:hypothetical protein
LFLLEIFRRDHAYTGGRLIERNVEACSRDYDWFGFRFTW